MEFRILGPLEVSAGDGAINGGTEAAGGARPPDPAGEPPGPRRPVDRRPVGRSRPEAREHPADVRVPAAAGARRRSDLLGGRRLRAQSRCRRDRRRAVRGHGQGRQGRPPSDPRRPRPRSRRPSPLARAPLADLSNEPSLRGEIARLEELQLSATEHRIAAEIEMGGHSTVVSELDALTAGTHSANGCGPT